MNFTATFVSMMLRHRRRRAGLVSRTKRLDSGEMFAYLDGGDGPPLLLLHGFGGSKDNFIALAGLLARTHRVIVPDHFGFGESARVAAADHGPVAQAKRLRRFVASLGIGRLHLAGNSMGGHIALTYAALFPQDVESVWVLNASGVWSGPRSEVHLHFQRTGENLLMAREADDVARTLAVVMTAPPRLPRLVLRHFAERNRADAALHQQVFEQVTADSLEARVKGLTVPALLTWGTADRVIAPGCADVLQALIPGSQKVMLPGIGHLPMTEAPEACAAAYATFRASLAVAPAFAETEPGALPGDAVPA